MGKENDSKSKAEVISPEQKLQNILKRADEITKDVEAGKYTYQSSPELDAKETTPKKPRRTKSTTKAHNSHGVNSRVAGADTSAYETGEDLVYDYQAPPLTEHQQQRKDRAKELGYDRAMIREELRQKYSTYENNDFLGMDSSLPANIAADSKDASRDQEKERAAQQKKYDALNKEYIKNKTLAHRSISDKPSPQNASLTWDGDGSTGVMRGKTKFENETGTSPHAPKTKPDTARGEAWTEYLDDKSPTTDKEEPEAPENKWTALAENPNKASDTGPGRKF